MRILHICNDFAGSKVHSNLVRELDLYDGVEQDVYCPVRKADLCGRNQFEARKVNFHYSFVIKPWHRYAYHLKCRTLFKDMKETVNLKDVDLIHASTLFSDGALAYRAFKLFKTPYVVAVRSVDIESFAKLLPHAWADGRKILLHASKVYFISNALLEKFCKLRFVRNILSEVKGKFELRPNGIDSFWLENLSEQRTNNHHILFVGSLIPRKNLVRLIDAVKMVRQRTGLEDTMLTVVGTGDDKKTKCAITHNRECVNYLGAITDKNQLKNVFREHAVFAVPSIHETFGLVYLEALSQNVPVLFTKGEGIDGMFTDETSPVGITVDAKSVDSIAEALCKLLTENESYSNEQIKFNNFNWTNIAKMYLNDYVQLVTHK